MGHGVLEFSLVRNLSTKPSQISSPDFIVLLGSLLVMPLDFLKKHLLCVYYFQKGPSSKLENHQLLSFPLRLMKMAATSGTVLNGLGSSFLCRSKRNGNSQALFSAADKTGGNVSPKRFIAVAAAAPKKSWLPGVRGGGNLVDPEWLDGSLPGDYGFDPLGLGKDPAFLKWYREAELIHGRWAMMAVVGIFVGQAWSGIPWFEAGADPGAVAPFSFGSLLGTQLLLMGWVESKRWVDFFNPESQSVEWATPWSRTAENFANATGDQGYPGGKFFDPLGLAGTITNGVYVPDVEKLERLKLAEIKHARIAMLAMLIFYFEAGQGKTPLGALGL